MSERDTGGPAFPLPEVRGADGCGIMAAHDGMTLRDYFAAQVMAGLCARAQMPETNGKPCVTPTQLAIFAYSQADAMLAERSRS